MKRIHYTLINLLFLLSITVNISQAFIQHGCRVQQRSSVDGRRLTKVDLQDVKLFTKEQLHEFAHNQGLEITLTTFGPGFRSTARSLKNRTEILGYVEGFTRGNILHLDKMEVFRKIVKRERMNNLQFTGGGTSLGVGLLMGYLCVLHGREAGCKSAEFLAIDDDDFLHKRLVRYYSAAGMDVVKYVGDDFRDIPDRMVWGGCGTLMRKDIAALLAFWSSILARSVERRTNS
ncbi:hypothetical protein MPSEU_000684100 [Mayamaea pseudoterrestris]|nr:hypothetical protein MPSEU_000684100 [Mayamaea pseudoterrestris]